MLVTDILATQQRDRDPVTVVLYKFLLLFLFVDSRQNTHVISIRCHCFTMVGLLLPSTSASKMTYIVSGAALNSTYSLVQSNAACHIQYVQSKPSP